jgi:cytochrome b6-f complex iron-sulfur subunit
MVLAPGLYSAFSFFSHPDERLPDMPQDVGSIDDFVAGSGEVVRFGSTRVMILKSTGGSVSAVSDVCTHLGCAIRFERSGNQPGELACNCHESRFNLDGENLSGPATKPLDRFQVRIDDGRVIVVGHDRSRE